MQLITDIDPSSPDCPEPSVSWLHWQPRGAAGRLADACFAPGRPLFLMEDEGRKLTREFPLVLWRQNAPESQISHAARLLDDLPPELRRVVLVAARGTMRGHFDRQWVAARGNLHATILIAESQPAAWAGMGLAILPVLALTDCAQGLAGPGRKVGIKWINDIMWDGAKIAGALSQSAVRGELFTHVVMGMGLNSHSTPPVRATPFVPRVGSLGLKVEEFPPLEVLKRLLSATASNYAILEREGGKELARRYIERCESIGRQVRIYEDGPGLGDGDLSRRQVLARGRLDEIKEDMRLVVGGTVIGSGRLAYEEDCPA